MVAFLKDFNWEHQLLAANQIGDEPLMFLKQHEDIRVGVCNSRRKGMENLLDLPWSKKPPVYLWTIGFQHRWVKPSCMLLLTTFDKPFTRDYLLPVGNLRELSEGVARADAVIVTKCPKDLSASQKSVQSVFNSNVIKVYFFLGFVMQIIL